MQVTKKVLFIAASVILVLAAAGGVAAYFLIQSFTHPSEDTAKFLPEETTFYVSMNLRPGLGQGMKAKEILERFKENPKFGEKLDDLYEGVEEELGINVKEELYPWLGPEIAFALVDFASLDEIPEIVILIGTTDYETSESFIRRVMDLGESNGTEYEEIEVNGYLTFKTDPYGETAYVTLTDNYVVGASRRWLLESTLERMQAGESRKSSLFDKPGFQEARDTAQNPRFGIMYMDIAQIIDQFGGETGEEFREPVDFLGDNVPDFIVASSAFIDKGIRVSTSFEAPSGWPTIRTDNSIGSAGLAPEDTVGLLSFVGTADAWNRIKEELHERETSELDDILAEIEDEIGIDLEEDIFGWMTGELAFAMRLPGGVFTTDEIHANGYIEFDDKAKALSGMGKVRAAMEDAGIEFSEIDVEGVEAVLLDLGEDDLPVGLSPGYLIMGRYVVIGTTLESLKGAVDALQGDIPTLRESSAFTRPLTAVGKAPEFMLYGNIARIVEAALDQADETALDEYADDVAPFLDPLEALLVGASLDEDLFTFSMVLTVE